MIRRRETCPLAALAIISSMEDLRLETVIRAHVEKVLQRYKSMPEAARVLGVGRTTLYRWRKEWKLVLYEYAPRKPDS